MKNLNEKQTNKQTLPSCNQDGCLCIYYPIHVYKDIDSISLYYVFR